MKFSILPLALAATLSSIALATQATEDMPETTMVLNLG